MKIENTKKFFAVALMASVTFVAFGCLASGGSLTNLPQEEFATMNLHIKLGRVDAAAPAGGDVLAKTAVSDADQIIVKNMVLRFTSNLKDTVWDTAQIVNDENVSTGVSGSEDGSQSVQVDVRLAPLRWWYIEIKTYDTRDSVIHYGVIGPFSSKGGQTVTMTVPQLNSRFSMYEARYVLPEAIYPSGVPDSQRVYQKIFFNRLVLSVDGVIVRDSTSFSPAVTLAGSRFITSNGAIKKDPGHFFFKPKGSVTDTIVHVQTYPYVLTGSRLFDIKAYGLLEGDSITATPRLLFHGSKTVSITPGAIIPEVPIVLNYTGPGSKAPGADTTAASPGGANWSGVSMNVIVGKTNKLVQTVEFPDGVPL